MWGLLFQRSALVCLVFSLVAVICTNSKRGNDHGMLSHQRRHRNSREHKSKTEGRNPINRPYQSKHQSSGAHLNKHSKFDSPTRQDFFLARRDYVPKQYINMPLVKKQNIFEKYYGNQGYPQMGDREEVVPAMERNMDYGTFNFRGGNMKSNGAKARKLNPNDLGYGDLKRVEDADQSVNEVINSIIDDDKNLEKAMSDVTGYRKPTPNPSEDFDVTVEENTGKTSVGSSYLPTKLKVPEVVKGGLQAANQVDGNDQTLQSSDGKTNGTVLAHSWSVDLDSAGNNEYHYDNGSQSNSLGSHGNVEGTNPLKVGAGGSNISNHIGNPALLFNQGSKGKEDDSNAYSEVLNEVDDSFKQSLNFGNDSVLLGGKNKEISSSNNNIITSDIVSTKLLNVSHKASGFISKDIESAFLGNLGDEVINNGSNQKFSNKVHLQGMVTDASNVINVTNMISDLHGKNNPISAQSNVAVLGNTAYENSIRNSSNTISQNTINNSTSFDNEESAGSSSHGNTIVTVGNADSSKSNNGNVHIEIIDSMPKKDDQNGRQDSSHSNTDNQLEQNGKNANDNIDNQQVESAATSSSFLKQHPNAFKILMEYFRKETSLQQKLRDRLNALRKTQINENAMKKSFASVHELVEMPKRPLPLRDFVADFLKFASENVPQKAKSQIISKAKANKQGFLKDKGKLTRQEKPSIVGAHRKIAVGLHNSVQASKQALPSRKADVTFVADFENVTEVAKEINGNITKIFQDAMNSNSQDGMKDEPSASSALGLAEERIDKIIAQNEIPQNVAEQYLESNARNEEETTSAGNNNAMVKEASGTLEGNATSVEATGSAGSNAIKVEAIGPVESNAMPNLARGPLVNHSNAISKVGAAPKKSDPISKEASYSIGQTSTSEALYDFIHAKSSYMDSKTMMYKRELKSLEVSLSQDFFNSWMYHYRSFEEMSIKPQQLRTGIATVGSTERLERVIKKALKGERINILIVGGSISAGGGLERDRHDLHGIYYKAFVEWWKTTVTPITTSDLKLNVVAIGGTDSEYFSYCIKNYIHDHPDLVLWELAANDYRRYEGREMDPGKPLEQLTRLLLTLPSQPALIFINYFRGDYYKTTLGQDCPDSEDESGRLMAEYYKITSLSWRNIICSQIKTDVRPSNSAKREFTPLTLKTLFSSDGYHPSLLGHAQCATLLISYIRSVFEEVVSREISRIDERKADDNTKSDKSNLPMPIYGDPVAPNPMCWTLLTPDFHRPIENQLPGMRIIEANGFEFTNITRWPVRMDRLRCLKALHSDASLRIKFDVSMNDKSSTKRDVAVISHNSFSGSARVWLDNDQNNALVIEEPSGQRRTQANIIKRVLQPGSHVITIRSITPGICFSALAIL